jgi:hypothetical protein
VTLRIYTKDGLLKGSDYVQQISNLDIWHIVGDSATGLGTAFTGGWVALSAPGPRFRKYPDGRVRIAGSAKTGASGNGMFVLPLGYRPTQDLTLPVMAAGGMAYVTISASSGNLIPFNLTGASVSTSVDLNSIEFDTESVGPWAVPVGVYTPPPLVTSLPTTGLYDGMEVYYLADATNGVIWHLRYRTGGGTYKWEVIGGAPLVAEYLPQQVFNPFSTGTWGTFNSDPAIVPPLVGEYNVDYTCSIGVSVVSTVFIGFQINGTEPSTTTSQLGVISTAGGTHSFAVRRKSQLNAGSTLRPRTQHNAGSSISVSNQAACLRAMPVRVG